MYEALKIELECLDKSLTVKFCEMLIGLKNPDSNVSPPRLFSLV